MILLFLPGNNKKVFVNINIIIIIIEEIFFITLITINLN